jgi:hypothetical protein
MAFCEYFWLKYAHFAGEIPLIWQIFEFFQISGKYTRKANNLEEFILIKNLYGGNLCI